MECAMKCDSAACFNLPKSNADGNVACICPRRALGFGPRVLLSTTDHVVLKHLILLPDWEGTLEKVHMDPTSSGTIFLHIGLQSMKARERSWVWSPVGLYFWLFTSWICRQSCCFLSWRNALSTVLSTLDFTSFNNTYRSEQLLYNS